MATTDAGERKAWGLLAERDPARVSERGGVGLDSVAGAFLVPAFGRRYEVAPAERRIRSLEPQGEPFLERHGPLFRLSVLWYLARVAAAHPGGNLLRPEGLPGGEIFFRGSHVLPLAALAARYARSPDAFLAAGLALGGRRAPYGDAAAELPALPKVPVTLILWTEDDEFPARADLLFDATAPRHLPTDILWSIAMLSLLPFLEPEVLARR